MPLYRGNLEKLLDESTFSDEILSFCSGSELYIVKEEHTAELIPVLVRLVYGKLQMSGSARTATLGTILRFFGSCTGNELSQFITIIRAPLTQREALLLQPNPTTVVPLKTQKRFD